MKNVIVDVYMDTSCPWCRMGTTSLLTALKRLPEDTKATVRWHAFQINPGIRAEGEDYRQVMIGRLGGEAQFEARKKQYNETGGRFGLRFDMERVKVTPNTTLSHQLIAITPEDRKERLLEKIYTAYFEEGVDIGKADELVRIAVDNGIFDDSDRLKARLLGGEGLEQTNASQRAAQKLGVRGVPFFVVNEKAAVSGLQSPDDLLNLFER